MSAPPFLESALSRFASVKALAEGAIAQVTDEQLHRAPGPDANDVAILMQHLSGNLRSRWTDFLTTDGEKPGRNRDGEFVDADAPRAALLEAWERGWSILFDTLRALTDADLGRTVTIRGEPHTVLDAILRQLSHYGYHVGQIVYVCRLFAGTSWKSLSVPRGESETYDRAMHREQALKARSRGPGGGAPPR